MSVTVFIIGAFIVLAALMSVFWRKSTLDRLPLWEDERILFEEDQIRAEVVMPPRGNTLFINCVIRLTNFRIIIAQKPLFSSRRQLRYVIYLRDAAGFPEQRAALVAGPLQSGYVTFGIVSSTISAHTESDKPYAGIIPEAGGSILSGIPKELKITLTRLSEFMAAVNQLR